MANVFTQNYHGGNLTLSGRIDETAVFPLETVTANQLLVDLGGIEHINSTGVKIWIEWLEWHVNTTFTFLRVPSVIVRQMNIVHGFLPKDFIIESFYVSYFCEELGVRKEVLFKNGVDFKDGKLTRKIDTLNDGENIYELDVLKTSYFDFLQLMNGKS